MELEIHRDYSGRKFALVISSLLFGLVVLISSILTIFEWLCASYLLMIFITDLLIIVFTIRLLKSKTSAEGIQAMQRIYLGVLFGMLAFIIGGVFEYVICKYLRA